MLRGGTVPAASSAEGVREIGVEIPSHNGWTNKGKLALPGDFGPTTPAVVLIHGSGPLDMDATMPGSITSDGRPSPLFKDLSDALAGAGFAVIRYNKRGVLGWDADSQRSLVDTKVYAANRVEDLVMDAAAAVRILRDGPGSGSRPVLLLGISEGTVLAPLAARLERVDGMILLSAMARRLEAALAGTGHPAVTVRTFPGLGHGFSPPRDGWEPTVGPIAPTVLEAVARWARAVGPFGR